MTTTHSPETIDAAIRLIKNQRQKLEIELTQLINKTEQVRGSIFELSEAEHNIEKLKPKT